MMVEKGDREKGRGLDVREEGWQREEEIWLLVGSEEIL